MTKAEEFTAYCGLYCADCLPSNQALFRAAEKLREELDKRQFESYAEIRSVYIEVFKDYEAFKKVLSEIIKLRCPAPCAKGGPFIKGGVLPDCPIRVCVHEKGLKGCWECSDFESCKLLEPLAAYHGDTPKFNLRLIKEYGIENWVDKRGKHYLWDR